MNSIDYYFNQEVFGGDYLNDYEENGIGLEISDFSVTIEDNGVGFSELKNNIKDILNPYFTTKKNGTGLGLSIVNKIINDHNGKIDFIPIQNGAKINITFLK